MSSDKKYREPEQRFFSGTIIKDMQRSILNIADRALITCINCENWAAFNETCKLNNKRPPAPIIAKGCECFVNCDIPF